MTTDTKERLHIILAQAGRDAKGDYRIYHSYRQMIEDLSLTPKEFERAIRELSKILRV